MTRRRGDRGAAIVEFALIVPILTLLAFATAEIAFASVAENRVQNAVAQAARVASSSGKEREADASVLLAVKASLPADQLANLDRVVVFRANAADVTVPTACANLTVGQDGGSSGQACNSYSGDTVRALTSITDPGFGGATCSGTKDRFWCPLDRKDSLADPPDWVGVWVRTQHTNPVSVFFGDPMISRQSVYRVQPDFTG
jgi:hypothetical protein